MYSLPVPTCNVSRDTQRVLSTACGISFPGLPSVLSLGAEPAELVWVSVRESAKPLDGDTWERNSWVTFHVYKTNRAEFTSRHGVNAGWLTSLFYLWR